jgi:hypothetical protein
MVVKRALPREPLIAFLANKIAAILVMYHSDVVLQRHMVPQLLIAQVAVDHVVSARSSVRTRRLESSPSPAAVVQTAVVVIAATHASCPDACGCRCAMTSRGHSRCSWRPLAPHAIHIASLEVNSCSTRGPGRLARVVHSREWHAHFVITACGIASMLLLMLLTFLCSQEHALTLARQLI